MEDDDLDDLFGDVGDVVDVGDVGDGHPLHLPELPEPLPKGLLQRVDELTVSGCYQYVAYFQRFASIYLNASQKAGLV